MCVQKPLFFKGGFLFLWVYKSRLIAFTGGGLKKWRSKNIKNDYISFHRDFICLVKLLYLNAYY